ncbi:hypothetical protein ASG86_12570 [Arthrobacter sp. Soil764]|nr:hypothetical protein ASG86_12570 [Arthrobacter sp. Soil764]
MTSWRDAASPQVQADLDGLLQPALGFAQQCLQERGEFYPYAVILSMSGEQEMFMAEVPSEQRQAPSVIDAITRDLAGQRDSYRAVAVVADVRIQDASDAIRVTLEHREGHVLAVLLPYSRRKFSGGYVFAELRGSTATPSVW